MVFIETPIFTRQVLEVLTDEQYALLQGSLVARPDSGDLIRGSSGIRKLRWALPGRGKSGGVRVINFLARNGISNIDVDDVREK
jgi:hypothetical protein